MSKRGTQFIVRLQQMMGSPQMQTPVRIVPTPWTNAHQERVSGAGECPTIMHSQ